MSPQVVTFGEAMLRLSPASQGRLAEADRLDLHVAGSESNVACALASLGVDVSWVSALPSSPLGRRVARELAASGVDIGSVEWSDDARLGLFFVEFGSAPRPTSVWYDREGSAFSRMDSLPKCSWASCDMAVTSGITLTLSERTRELALEFMRRARDGGSSVFVDVNYRERVCSASAARSAIGPALEDADVVVCSRADADRVFDVAGEELGEIAVALRDRWAPESQLCVVTDGPNGCAGVSGTDCRRQPAFDADVVDRIGAGDAFVAGLLWGLVGDRGLERALEAAAAMGALACTVRGDIARFTPAEVAAVARHRSGELIR